jgi:hypothetical protein
MSKELEIIKDVYYKLNEEFLSEQPYNTKQTRFETIWKLMHPIEKRFDNLVKEEKRFSNIDIRIICDEENNTPEVIDKNTLVARVEWKLNKLDETIHYVNLTFGNVEIELNQNKQLPL